MTHSRHVHICQSTSMHVHHSTPICYVDVPACVRITAHILAVPMVLSGAVCGTRTDILWLKWLLLE